MSRAPIRIANASGFYGDRLPAMLEVLQDGPVDVITGDYLAELTMLILWKARRKDSSAGYARTFLTQLEQVLGIALDRGAKIVTNAGGLNPAGLAERVAELAAKLGLAPKVAWIDGDDLAGRLPQLLADGHDFTHLDTGRVLRGSGVEPLTANAYLGGWGITAALDAGADIVICPRVTDASLVTGPAAWWHGWARDDFDALAGAVVAGHVIECGPQATGGNYSFPQEITTPGQPGYPIAEVAADGSSVITKHPGTGGVVSTGTVTAQLLYEIGAPAYHNPDVIAHFDTVALTKEAPDRVRIHGARGTAPSGRLKVAINYAGGFRNTMTLVLTGLDIESKAAAAQAQLFDALGGRERFDEVDVRLLRFDRPDAPTNAQATAHLQITVKARDSELAGRQFSGAAVGLYLGGYAGFHTTTPPTGATEFGVYWPALIPAAIVTQRVTLPDGTSTVVPHTGEEGASWSPGATEERGSAGREADRAERHPDRGVRGAVPPGDTATVRAPLGLICGARSGDKGGNANVGLWTRTDEEYAWLRGYLSTERFRQLLPEAADLPIQRYELPNLRAVNFVVVGLLGDGVASSARPDPQAKGLGEYVRSRYVDLPAELAP
ncbi:MAG TPA: acyclic terpene utilization AtuA family protein [Trebonia sp.]|nr:acyclic terpene utilization AtuA family protein [Trebonia sp.]